MEENIRKCEEFINLSFLYGKLSFTKTQLYEYQTAMSTLLTRYKQLEEENKRIKSFDIYKLVEDWETGQLIPVSKVKEKKEELDKEEKRELKGTKGQDRYYIKQKYMYKRKVLEELLERTG